MRPQQHGPFRLVLRTWMHRSVRGKAAFCGAYVHTYREIHILIKWSHETGTGRMGRGMSKVVGLKTNFGGIPFTKECLK